MGPWASYVVPSMAATRGRPVFVLGKKNCRFFCNGSLVSILTACGACGPFWYRATWLSALEMCNSQGWCKTALEICMENKLYIDTLKVSDGGIHVIMHLFCLWRVFIIVYHISSMACGTAWREFLLVCIRGNALPTATRCLDFFPSESCKIWSAHWRSVCVLVEYVQVTLKN